MYHIMERRGLWFLISVIATIPAIVYMAWSLSTRGTLLPLSIDFTGGTLWEMRFEQPVQPTAVREIFVKAGYSDTSAYSVVDQQTVEVKLKTISADEKSSLVATLTQQVGKFEERTYRSIGPTIGNEVSRAAVLAVAIASLLILLYLALAFRQVANPFRYGICAVIALIHDVLVTISFLCVMNLIAGWEMDALFLTALLTVIGYSVSDTIVVFDRIRENFRRFRGETLGTISNRSIVETAVRSLGTHVTTLLTMVSILVLGGPTIRQFMATLVVGVISGTYSSIFNATALLVAWDERALLHSDEPSTSNVNNGRTALA